MRADDGGLPRPWAAVVPPIAAVGPALAAAVAVVVYLVRRDHVLLRTALVRWSAVLGPAWLLAVLLCDPLHAQILVLLLIAVGLDAARPYLPRGRGWLVLFAASLTVLAAELGTYQRTFGPLETEVLEVTRLQALVTGTQHLAATEAPGRPWYRTWSVGAPAAAFEVALSVRAFAAPNAATWYVRDARAQPLAAGHDAFLFADTSSRAWRTWTSDQPLGGTHLRLTGEALVPAGVTIACGPVALAVDERPWVRRCAAEFVGTGDWTPFAVTWEVPASVTERRLRIEAGLVPAATIPFEVRGLALARIAPGATTEERVTGIVPAEVTLSLERRGPATAAVLSPTSGIPADGTWHALRARLEAQVDPNQQLVATLRAPGGVALEVRGVVATSDTGRPRAWARPQRAQAWFGHPNLAGHALAAWLLLALSRAPRRRTGWLALFLALAAIAATGSRSAFAIAAVLGPLLQSGWLHGATPRSRGWRLPAASALAYGAILVATFALSPRVATVTADANTVPRAAIWSSAWAAISEKPWTGWGSAAAAAALDERLAARGHGSVAHAHNLWLDLGVRLGIPGMAAGGWLALLLVIGAARSGVAASTSVVGLLALNVVDTTLLVTYVWAPAAMLAAGAGTGAGYNAGAKRDDIGPRPTSP